MPKYLVAADADQIQDLLFRATHLRELEGGSRLLTRFCLDAPRLLAPDLSKHPNDLVVHDGGNFRVLFDDKETARTFARELAALYQASLDGSLTVLDEPIELLDVKKEFAEKSKQAQRALAAQKEARQTGATVVHFPYIAFCVSCGTGLTTAYAKRDSNQPRAQFLCAACQSKAQQAKQSENESGFMPEFLKMVLPMAPPLSFTLKELDYPGKAVRAGKRERDAAGDIAAYDARGYVAYLLADANGMGKVFGACNAEQMQELSTELPKIMRAALAEPARKIMRAELDESEREQKGWDIKEPNFVPALPLILGGDDLFALIPAPWALDIAQHFCRAFNANMQKLLDTPSFKTLDVSSPTISAAVVICKQNYPFALAHTSGKKRLEYAKRLAKLLKYEHEQQGSAMSFQVILGSQVGGDEAKSNYRETLRPYWLDGDVEHQGFAVQKLLEQRFALKELAAKRRAELRTLFAQTNLVADNPNLWQRELETLLTRIGRRDERDSANPTKSLRAKVENAIEQLGGKEWYQVERSSDDTSWQGHGLPDLLDLWDFTWDLKWDPSEYKEE